MDRKQPEILKDKDVLGMDKPEKQPRPLKKRTDNWLLILTLFLLVIAAGVLFYFKK